MGNGRSVIDTWLSGGGSVVHPWLSHCRSVVHPWLSHRRSVVHPRLSDGLSDRGGGRDICRAVNSRLSERGRADIVDCDIGPGLSDRVILPWCGLSDICCSRVVGCLILRDIRRTRVVDGVVLRLSHIGSRRVVDIRGSIDS